MLTPGAAESGIATAKWSAPAVAAGTLSRTSITGQPRDPVTWIRDFSSNNSLRFVSGIWSGTVLPGAPLADAGQAPATSPVDSVVAITSMLVVRRSVQPRWTRRLSANTEFEFPLPTAG